MSLGTTVRRALGRHEPTALRLYRSAFIDLDALADSLATVVPTASRVVEVGCGDGSLATALRRALPGCELLGLDPLAPTPGRMYEGERGGVEFRSITTSQLIAEQPEPFDLVMLCDVLHHVAETERVQVLRDAAALTAAGGTVAVKEWERRPGVANALAYCADRWVSGDPTVRFMPRSELESMIDEALPEWACTSDTRIRPRRANLLLTFQKP